MKHLRGFTLVELMVAVAIVGIITSIAYPNYKNSVKKSRRAGAEGVLLQDAAFLERYFTENNCYKVKDSSGACVSSGTNPTLPVTQSPPTGTKFYDIAIQAGDGTTFTLRATPTGAQNGDGILDYLNTGEKKWDKNNDGSFGTDEKTW